MNRADRTLSRRSFVKASALASGAVMLSPSLFGATNQASSLVAELPKGSAPEPVAMPHFPSRVHAFIWRNWSLVPAATMARVIGATRDDILRLGRSMGLPKPPRITREQRRRSYISVIKRNWHLLPYEQLLALLDWTPEHMAFVLREDDFLYIKLGNLKPKCAPLKFNPADEKSSAHIAKVLREEFPKGLPTQGEELFEFVTELSRSPERARRIPHASDTPRFCYSYFALYGDPLLDADLDPYPDGYLERLARAGVNGVWLQALLFKLAPFPWNESLSARHEERIRALAKLVARARKHGIGIYLYLNEPRSMPLKFFANRPELKGVTEGDHAALCTTNADVQRYLKNSVAQICRAVPDLAGFFTITASENLTNCWSHGGGKNCPRCAQRPPADVIAGVNSLVSAGIEEAGSNARLFAWDWGWNDAWASDAIRQLPLRAALMSVSEWSLPIERGGVKTAVGEYSISAIGPGPRAQKHWNVARERGLKTLAKVQAGNTWELSAVPYIPAVENVARHAANLRDAGVDGLMLGWTLGGYPSPNLEVVSEISDTQASPDEAMQRVAERRFGASLAPQVVAAWKQFSAAFSEFPYHGNVVYSAPLQVGPANLLWERATGYAASMVGFPYDHLNGWRGVYPADVFIAQLEKVASGFKSALATLRQSLPQSKLSRAQTREAARELSVAEAAATHFESVANQARFVGARNALAKSADRSPLIAQLEKVLRDELTLAKRLLAIQSRDSRIGFEATNQYYYVREDLLEKVINCRDLLDRWLPSLRV
jgi:hypothetical protein